MRARKGSARPRAVVESRLGRRITTNIAPKVHRSQRPTPSRNGLYCNGLSRGRSLLVYRGKPLAIPMTESGMCSTRVGELNLAGIEDLSASEWTHAGVRLFQVGWTREIGDAESTKPLSGGGDAWPLPNDMRMWCSQNWGARNTKCQRFGETVSCGAFDCLGRHGDIGDVEDVVTLPSSASPRPGSNHE